MSWHYSQAQAADFSVDDYLAGLRSAQSRLKSTPGTSCSPDKGTGAFQPSLFGTMSVPLTGIHGTGSPMSSPEDFHARTLARRVAVKDLPESVRDYGLKCSVLLERCGLLLSSRKTVRTFVPVALASSSKDLPAWGMTFGGVCWGLGTRVIRPPRTEGTACGYMLPTPTANEYGTNTAIGGKPRPSLSTMARQDLWPTPMASDWKNMDTAKQVSLSAIVRDPDLWPTPTARDWKDTPGFKKQRKDGKRRDDLLPRKMYIVEQTPSRGGHLNPTWVEWLMGWPLGWTERRGFSQSAMDRFQQWLRLHGVSSTEQTDER